MRDLFRKIYLLFKRNKSVDDLVWLYNHTRPKKRKEYFYERALKEYALEAPTSFSKEEAKENMLLFIKEVKNFKELTYFEVGAGYWGKRLEAFS